MSENKTGVGNTSRSERQPHANKMGEANAVTQDAAHAEFNVYAPSFVPEAYKTINEESGTVVVTESRHRIDYSAYAQSFVGSAFFPPRQPATDQKFHCDSLSESRYLEYFLTQLDLEKAARIRENEQYALYKVLLQRYVQDDQELFTIQVPGLREDSPLIEMGDTIQLRPLFVDGYGNLADIHLLFAAHNHHRHWTGTIWNATVQYVHRASETVYLRADGLTETWIGNVCFALFVNVVFPQKEEAARVTQEALTYVSYLLNADSVFKSSTQQTQDRARKSMNIDDITLGGNSYPSEPQNGKSNHSDISPYQNSWIRKMLFPDEFDGQWQRELRSHPLRKLFDPQLNYEQVQAVDSVCKNDYGTLPYCISGPPGTGKTKTLVEITMQLLKDHIVDHILICAPSDQAADTLALRLKNYLSTTQLFRLNGPSRDESEVPRELIGTDHVYMENGIFYLPPFQKLMKYNVVVTSCRDASILMQARLTNADLWEIERGILSSIHPEHQIAPPPLHWGALLVDEAAQAVELDVLPAISVISSPANYPTDRIQLRFVMAGDEKQLGPRTASRDPNYSRSLFARLLERPLYKNHPLSRANMKPSADPSVLTQAKLPILYPPFANLIRNYRSHPAILSVPSSLFYNDTLIPEKPPPSSTTKLSSCTLWQGRKWPVLYVPNTGPDDIEREGGGWYNYSEAMQACRIAQKLITEADVPQEDICIMSPFAAQVRVLRNLMRSGAYGSIAGGSGGYWYVNIGPVEAFQGLEKRVVILCTTRSRPSFVDADVARGLGIVKFPRKMNVALTRAMEGLVVIGSPEVLGMDEEWRQWLAFCARNGLVHEGGSAVGKLGEEERIGVLERALVAKEGERRRSGARVLGGAVGGDDWGYEAWVQDLREAIDEEFEEEQGEEEDEEDEEIED